MIHHGDCVEVMATFEADSIDAIVTDPPYGLEFMGREWDKLDDGLPQENVWKGRRGKGGSDVGNDDTKPSSRHHVSYGVKHHQFRRCSACGKREFSGSPCRCEEPEWVVEVAQAAPTSAIRMQRWHERWAREAYRVAKPGAHLLAFGGTRTYHRLAAALEDAGWEIRDCLVWAYASGFPKSLDVSKAIDKAAGADSLTPEAAKWQGWGTALKPAWEPIVLARKPLRGTVARNVQEYGTGALNIDGTRIPFADPLDAAAAAAAAAAAGWDETAANGTGSDPSSIPFIARPDTYTGQAGRWPANVVLTDPIFDGGVEGVVGGGETASGKMLPTEVQGSRFVYGRDALAGYTTIETYGDSGTYSRFFLIPKADRADREPVLGGPPTVDVYRGVMPDNPKCLACGRRRIGALGADPCSCDEPRWAPNRDRQRANSHPTVKPTELMRHLVRLVTPPGGTVLDPFLGSGTTALAAEMEGFAWIGIEREAEYVRIAEARLNGTQRGLGLSA